MSRALVSFGPRQLRIVRPAAAAVSLLVVTAVDLVLLVHRAMLDVVSPYDEGYHLSHVQYASQWSVPRVGDSMLGWAKQAFSCHVVFPYGPVTPVPCGEVGDSVLYPEGGTNTAAAWPPGYYLFAAQVVRLLTAATSLDPLYAARIASCLLWAAGCVLLSYLVLRASGSTSLAVAVGVLATANPAAWAIGSYVTPHSTAMLVGALLIAGLLWVAGPRIRPRWTWAAAGLGGILIGLTLPHALVAVGAVCVALVVMALHRRPHSRRILLAAVVLGAANLATYLAWAQVVAARTVGTQAAQPTTPPEGLGAALRDNWDLFLPRFVSDVAFTSPVQNQAAHLLGYVLVGFLGYWLLAGRMPAQRAIAVGLVVAAPVAATVMALQLDYPVPTRYGASILALWLFLTALRERPRWLPAALLLLAAAFVVVTWEGTDSYLVLLG